MYDPAQCAPTSRPHPVALPKCDGTFLGTQCVTLIRPRRYDIVERSTASVCERSVSLGTGRDLPLLALLTAAFCLPGAGVAQTVPNDAAIDAEVSKITTLTHGKGMAVAVIDHGKVGYVQAYGI